MPLGRAGYAAKGVVYLLVGVLAAQAAMGTGGDTTDSEGALLHILQAPSGNVLLGLIALGLAGYALWCALAAGLDVEHKGADLQGVVARAGYAVTALIYGGLALTALGLIMGTRGTAGGDQATQDRTAWLMHQAFGSVLVAGVGLIVCGAGIVQLSIAARGSFREHLDIHGRQWLDSVGRAGYAAHGIALGLIGAFLVVAAVESRPDQAHGLGGALAILVQQPFGPALLGLLGVGLAAFGIFSLAEARYRRMIID